MTIIFIILWLLSGFIPTAIYMKREFGNLDIGDTVLCALAGCVGPIIPLLMAITWIINKL